MLPKGFICKNIKENEICLGTNIEIESNVRLIGIGEGEKSFIIGDNVYIGEDVKIVGNQLKIMDYTKIHNNCFLYAPKPISIGYNCWIGQNSILNADEELIIGNNVGIGAYSQLWTHIKFGDTLEGCRFHSYKKMLIEDDVWFVGHCIVSPITAHRKSMAMVGSVIVKDMEENHVYAGTPAADITEKIGNQFTLVSEEDKYQKMQDYLKKFLKKWKGGTSIQIVLEYPENIDSNISYFNVKERTYIKRNSDVEQAFMKYLLPEKAKFLPKKIS